MTRTPNQTASAVIVFSVLTLTFASGCGESAPADPAAESAPAAEEPKSAAPASATTQPAVATGPLQESSDILYRSAVTESSEVKHILIAWSDLAGAYSGRIDERAKQRSKVDADALTRDLLARAVAGADFDALMREHSEDPGSAKDAKSYPVSADAQLVPPFKNLGLRLNVDEVGLVLTRYGWHIIKRVA